jgi:gamma-glutamyltranspeptidase/glutathione hydrolase
MIATSQPLAAIAGLRTLMEGGNAVDAAVTAAAALSVVEPFYTGIGGDLFALVWIDREKQVRSLNGSGRAAAAASIDELKRKGLTEVPYLSPYAVTVPGTVDGWNTLLEGYGSMPLAHVLKPAIEYAEEGYPVSDMNSWLWATEVDKLSQRPSGAELMLDGRAPRHGEIVHLPELGRTLRTIAEGGPEAFYKGELAEKTAAFVQEQGGWLSAGDMASHTSDWDEPISTDYRGVTCWECPPNDHGLAALMALNIAEGFDIKGMGYQTPDTYHHLIESMRLSFADALRYIADPRKAQVPTEELLSKRYAEKRRSLVKKDRALSQVIPGDVKIGSDTVYVSCVDGQGNACSLINSLYEKFGTGLVVPGTGVALQNRGSLFSLDPTHPNALEPGKRPYHTIIPALATRNGELWLTFGVMGMFQQPQGHLQVMVNMVDFGMDPQATLNALRFSVQLSGGVALEEGIPKSAFEDLRSRGHDAFLVEGYGRYIMGGGLIIERDMDTGVLSGGSEPRKDGCAIGW